MTPEQLLKPRYKVIADYPQPPYNEGDEHKFIEGDVLIQCNVNSAITFKRTGRLGYMSVDVPCCRNPEKYPKIFKKLEWWEERKIEEMPEYVKCIESPDGTIMPNDILMIIEWNVYGGKIHNAQWIFPYTNCYQPATKYKQYINQKQNNGTPE